MTENELAFASIQQIGKLYRRRKLSPLELTKLMLARIERLNPKLNAYITVTADVALAQAKKAEREIFAPGGRKGARDRGPLHGIPISLKDNIYTKGIRTTAGSKILRDFIPDQDAVVWSKLKSAGAILLGKTNLHEFAYGVTTNNPHFGPTRNPWDLARIPGGSSGGSAAAVAAGLCYGSIGTDTGGSIRIPAALCGIVGFKPAAGRVSTQGVVPLSTLLDSVGPLARTMDDAILILAQICEGTREFAVILNQRRPIECRNITLGVPKDFFLDIVAEDVQRQFEVTIRRLTKKKIHVKEVSIPQLAATEEAGNHIAWPEATHYHQQMGWFPARAAEYGEDVRSRLEMGTKVSAIDYLRAMEARVEFIFQLDSSLHESGVNALLVPTTPISAPRIGEESTPIGAQAYPTRALLLRNNRPANLAGAPAISIPCGFTPTALPIGVQLIGLATKEPGLTSLVWFIESLTEEPARFPVL